MNNYCIHLKKRKNKPYCNLINKEIRFSLCRECGNKEYKPKNKENSLYKNKKSTLERKSPAKSGTMKNKSKELAKLERNRFSVFTDDNKCFVCDSTYQLTWHEIYAGRNRINSMIYGFCLRMCLNCHDKYQDDVEFNDYWHKRGQLYWEEFIGSREEFIMVFRRNYIK